MRGVPGVVRTIVAPVGDGVRAEEPGERIEATR
jgi:hypothetical protein